MSAIPACIIHWKVDLLLQGCLSSKLREMDSEVDQPGHLEEGRSFSKDLTGRFFLQ